MGVETTAGGVLFLAGRVIFGLVIAFMGVNHFTDLESMRGYAAAKGIPAPSLAVAVSGLMLVGGGLSIAIGVLPLVGAIALVVFFLIVTPTMHDFWSIADPETRQGEMIHFLKNVGFLGVALVFVAISAMAGWPYALDIGR